MLYVFINNVANFATKISIFRRMSKKIDEKKENLNKNTLPHKGDRAQMIC